MSALKIEIAGICGKIVSKDEGFIHRVSLEYKDFLTRRKEDFLFTVSSHSQNVSHRSYLDSQSLLDQNLLLIAKNRRYSFVLEKEKQIKVGFLDINKRETHLYRLAGQEVGSYFDLMFMHVIRLFLVYNRGLFLHASGVIKDNQAFIFTGPDESGKTTASTLLPGVFVASDDSLAIKKKNGSYYLYTIPWGSRNSVNSSARIAKIFFLRKAHRLKIEKMRTADVAREFLTNIFFNSLDKRVYEETLETIDNLIDEVDCYRLYFSRKSNLDSYLSFKSEN